jgi:hypothetical protein
MLARIDVAKANDTARRVKVLHRIGIADRDISR